MPRSGNARLLLSAAHIGQSVLTATRNRSRRSATRRRSRLLLI
jgi:hypothetical protein